MIRAVLLVALGGAVGSALRFLTSAFVGKYFQGSFASPIRASLSGSLATFFTNLIGCFVIGILMGYFLKSAADHSQMRFLLVTGFCGGYTTFSAFAYENVNLMQQNNYATAFGYVVLSVVAGLAAVWAGMILSR